MSNSVKQMAKYSILIRVFIYCTLSDLSDVPLFR